jgi:Spy/CpxP family protein refolding chaperone
MNGLSKWPIVLYLAGIFLAGGVSGWVIARQTDKQTAFTAPQPKEIAISFRDRLHARLNLTDDQARQIDGLIERSSTELGALHSENIKQIRTVLSNRNAQICAVLGPEQKQQFDQMEKERREAWRQKEQSHGKRGGHEDRRSRDKSGTNNAANPSGSASRPQSKE